jgi:hypothetical protein
VSQSSSPQDEERPSDQSESPKKQSAPSNPVSAWWAEQSSNMQIFVIAVVALAAMWVLGTVLEELKKEPGGQESSLGQERQPTSSRIETEEEARFNAMSPDEHFHQAQMAQSEGNLDEMDRHLDALEGTSIASKGRSFREWANRQAISGGQESPDQCAAFSGAKQLPPFERRVAFELRVTGTADGIPTVTGRTNLPDDTKLMVTIERGDGMSAAQSNAEVANGCFVAGPFRSARPLSPGRYKVNVTMPFASVQPANVRSQIGVKGSKLRGPLVKVGDIVRSRVVEFSDSFFVGASEASASVADGHRQQAASEIRAELARMIREGRGMESLRTQCDNDALSACSRCGEAMRRLQSRARELEQRADQLDERLLTGAARQMKMCGNCTQYALQHCRLAAEALSDWDRISNSRNPRKRTDRSKRSAKTRVKIRSSARNAEQKRAANPGPMRQRQESAASNAASAQELSPY